LWRVSIDGGEPTKFSDDLASFGVISPDGRLIAYDTQEGQPVLVGRVVVIPAEGGKRLYSFNRPTSSAGLSWAPDGHGLDYIDIRNGLSNIWRQPLSGSSPKRITDFSSGRMPITARVAGQAGPSGQNHAGKGRRAAEARASGCRMATVRRGVPATVAGRCNHHSRNGNAPWRIYLNGSGGLSIAITQRNIHAQADAIEQAFAPFGVEFVATAPEQETRRVGTNLGTAKKKLEASPAGTCWCERRDSNPHGFPHQILSLARLPVPPLSHV
jgi:hypothetical protein